MEKKYTYFMWKKTNIFLMCVVYKICDNFVQNKALLEFNIPRIFYCVCL